MFPILIVLLLLLYGCNAKEQSNLDTKKENLSQSGENFHKNIDKDLFQIINVKDLLLGDYLNKKVAIKGKVYAYTIDDYKNFKFSISDSTGEVKCFWYSIDRQESSKMFKNLESAQMQSDIVDNYYNVIVYGKYQKDPKNVGEKNIFVYDIEFVEVELGSNATLGGIPIWSNHNIDIEDDSNITESSNDSFNKEDKNINKNDNEFEAINTNEELLEKFEDLWNRNGYKTYRESDIYHGTSINVDEGELLMYYQSGGENRYKEKFAISIDVYDGEKLNYENKPLLQESIDLLMGKNRIILKEYESKIEEARLKKYGGPIYVLETKIDDWEVNIAPSYYRDQKKHMVGVAIMKVKEIYE